MRSVNKLIATTILLEIFSCLLTQCVDKQENISNNMVVIKNQLVIKELSIYIHNHNMDSSIVVLMINNRKKYTSISITSCSTLGAFRQIHPCYYTFAEGKPVAITVGTPDITTGTRCDQGLKNPIPGFIRKALTGDTTITNNSYLNREVYYDSYSKSSDYEEKITSFHIPPSYIVVKGNAFFLKPN